MPLNRTHKVVLPPTKIGSNLHIQLPIYRKYRRRGVCQRTRRYSNWQNKHSGTLYRTNNLISSTTKKREKKAKKIKRGWTHREIWEHHLGPPAKSSLQTTPAPCDLTTRSQVKTTQSAQPTHGACNDNTFLKHWKREKERNLFNISTNYNVWPYLDPVSKNPLQNCIYEDYWKCKHLTNIWCYYGIIVKFFDKW